MEFQSMAAAPSLLLLWGTLLGPSAARPPTANASSAPIVEVRVGALLPEDSRSFLWARPRVAAALGLALEALQPQLRLVVRTAFASSDENRGCDKQMFLFKAVDLKHSHDPDVLLVGHGCYIHRSLLGPFVRYWGMLLFRAGPYWSPSDRVPEVVYAGPLGPSLPAFQMLLFERFNWTRRAFLAVIGYTDSGHYFDFLWDARGYKLETPFFSEFVFDPKKPGETVRSIQANTRVAFICGPPEMLQQIMHLADAQNMTNGDYVFFYIDLFGESLRAAGHREAAKPWQSKESNDTGGLREAFQTVLVITPHEPQTPEYRRFENELVLRAQRDFGVAINDSLGHLLAGCHHDLLLLYLRALNETLHEGGTKQDTGCILEKMRSMKFQGITGMVSINSNNDREMDFDLWAMRDVETGEFQVVAHYIASEKRISWTGDILWKKGGPPLDNPPCVFDNDDPSCGEREYVQGERDLPFIKFFSPSLLPQAVIPVC